MIQSQRILAKIFFVHIFLIPTALAACPTIFYAKPIEFEDIKKIDFYHTQLNVQTASECANICGEKQFCRTAVYNHEAKTCASSFDVKIECIKTRQRYNVFFSTSTSPLSIIACIDRCKKGEFHKPLDFIHEKSGENIEKPEKPKFSPKFAVHVTTPEEDSETTKILLITSPSDETFTPSPIVITEDDLNASNKTIKLIPQHIELNAAAADGTNKVNLNEIVRQIQNFTVVKKHGGALFTVKTPKDKIQLVTISPEDFEKIVDGEGDDLLKTMNMTGKIQVEGNDIEKIIETIKQQIDARQKILGAKDGSSANDEASSESATTESSASQFTTTTEPIVINGKVLSPQKARELVNYERTSTTTTTTPRPIILTTEEGFMNTFVISGVGNMFREALADRFNEGQGHLSPTHTPSSDGAASSTSCYRSFTQQLLYRAEFKKIDSKVSINECRCICAKTWESEEIKPKCKSLQFKESTGECWLNREDHTGKYDLIFNKDVDYHYITCDIGILLDTKQKMCGDHSPESTSTLPLSISTESPQKAETSSSSSPKYKGDESQIVKDEIPAPALTIAEIESLKTKLKAIKPKKSETNAIEKIDVMFSTTVFPSTEEDTTVIPITLPSVERTTIKEKKINLVTTDETESPKTTEEVSPTTTTTRPPTTTTTTPSAIITTSSGAATVETTPKKEQKCFENFEGKRLTTKPGGLESDVTLEECQCFCANSRTSSRYQFQCLSALYYHNERDCMLFIDNRQLKPEAFIDAPKSDGNVTYLGMTCPLSKTIETHVNSNYDFGCVKPESTTTSLIKTTTTATNTDDCFVEDPLHVLEGDFLATESNITLEECKCYCIDSESRYGTHCQSFEYYYKLQTCFLSKENRITDPQNFAEDTFNDQMRSYFDYTCRSERMMLSVYVEQVCQKVVEIDLKKIGLGDIGPPSAMPDNSAPNTDEKSTEVKKDSDASAEKNDDAVKVTTSTATTTTTTTTEAETPSSSSSTTTTTTEPTKPPTTLKYNKNLNKPRKPKQKSKAAEMEELSSEEDDPSSTTSTTTQSPTTTTTPYKPIKSCDRSALYQTVFVGDKQIKSLTVTNADECFAACHAEKCRSANLIHLSGVLKTCELFKDSIIDFRRTDVLNFDPRAVHFDAIKCVE